MADIAAEPIHPSTPEQIISQWGVASSAITHSYGFAEATIWVSSARSEFDSETHVAVSGDLEWSHQLKMDIVIADKESGTLVPDGTTGDIFVQGIGIVNGYWNNPEASKAFDYELQGKQGKWYLSGDLGYIKQGKLFLTVRSKDVIIVNGKNIYATDIERRVEEAFPLILRPGCSAAFQVGDDEAVVICEFKPGQESSLEANQLISLRKSLEQEFGLKIKDIVCTRKGTVPKTTSGKIRRLETKKQYQLGNIQSSLNLSEKIICDTFEQLLKVFDIQDFEKTLLENGIDSLKLTRLMEDAHSQFGITIDFMMAQEVPCKDLEVVAQQQTKAARPKPKIPKFELQGKRMKWHILWQLILVLIIVVLVATCTIPSAFLHQFLTSSEFVKNHPGLVEPWLMTFSRGPGFLLVIVPIVWMLTYSLLVVLMKWILIGRYQPGRYALWSVEFAKWWFMDRLLEVWEIFVGSYFLDTPYLNIFYKLLGMECDVTTVRFHTFVREFDLIHCASYSRIKGMVLARLIDRQGLILDHVHVEENLKLESTTVTYPGTVISNELKDIQEATFTKCTDKTSIWDHIQRNLFPLVYMCFTTGFLYFLSWATSHYQSTRFEWEAGRLLICFYGSNVLLLMLSGLLVRLRIFDFTADRIAGLCDGMIGLWTRYTPLIAILHKILYGCDISVYTEINGFTFVSPSKSRFLKVGRGSTISSCFLNVEKGFRTTIGENCSLGLFSRIDPGVTIEDNAAIATFAHASSGSTIEKNTSYFTPEFSTQNQTTENPSLTIWDLFKTIVTKLMIQMPGILLIIGFTIYAVQWLHSILDASLAIRIPILTMFAMFIGGIISVILDTMATWLFVPNCHKSKDTIGISIVSWKCAFYIHHLGYHYITDNFVYLFCGGSILMAWFHMLMGAKIDRPSDTLLMGIFCDSKNLIISPHESTRTDDFYFVTDIRSFFESHRLEHGEMRFQLCESLGQVSLHPNAVVMGQQLENVTIGKRSRVVFPKRVKKNTSGFHYGMPSYECNEDETTTVYSENIASIV
jgi:carbonic anhydrase/acetyltransferase-like protein (isoleucine patch superfamily)/acyl carrier protein